MSILDVSGKATREIPYDVMSIDMGISVYGNSTSEASKSLMEGVEKILAELVEKGISIEDVQLSSNNISQHENGGRAVVSASRRITWKMGFDMAFLNQVMEWIGSADQNIDIRTDFFVSNLDAIREELTQEALLDSKMKAEALAETLGMKVVGLERVESGDRYGAGAIMYKQRDAVGSSYALSDQLGAPSTEEEVSISAQWRVE